MITPLLSITHVKRVIVCQVPSFVENFQPFSTVNFLIPGNKRNPKLKKMPKKKNFIPVFFKTKIQIKKIRSR